MFCGRVAAGSVFLQRLENDRVKVACQFFSQSLNGLGSTIVRNRRDSLVFVC
jgi:hypothetical protein